MNAYLLLANGMVFAGRSVGAEGVTVGEVVFATGMVGFQETLTDPSYYGQIITQTYPLIGNYGMNKDDMESDKIWARGMNLMHSCYACGALLCPFFIAAAGRVSGSFAVLVLAVLGLLLWLVYMGTPFVGRGAGRKEVTDWSFLRSTRFWLLTGLLFCQNAAEQSVTGWMVTYFKGSGIIAGTLAAYTVTVMWGATLVARLLIAFVFPFKQPRKAMVVMGVSCTIFYILLVQARSQGAAIALLFAFAFAMAGMNPTAVASAGRMTSVTSMGIMLPVAASGAILMPWVIGVVAESAGLAAGMMTNIVPCVGLVIFAVLVAKLPEE